MNDQAATTGRSEDFPGRRPSERNSEIGSLAWVDVDRVLEVRARLVAMADELEAGDIRTCEVVLMDLLLDLDDAERIVAA